MAKMPSNVRDGSLASAVVEATAAVLETANTVARARVSEYELLKFLRRGFLVLFQYVHYGAVALAKKCLVLSRECLRSLCHGQSLWVRCIGEMNHDRMHRIQIFTGNGLPSILYSSVNYDGEICRQPPILTSRLRRHVWTRVRPRVQCSEPECRMSDAIPALMRFQRVWTTPLPHNLHVGLISQLVGQRKVPSGAAHLGLEPR